MCHLCRYSVSVIVAEVVFIERVCILLGRQLGGMLATFAYDVVALCGAWMLDSWV